MHPLNHDRTRSFINLSIENTFLRWSFREDEKMSAWILQKHFPVLRTSISFIKSVQGTYISSNTFSIMKTLDYLTIYLSMKSKKSCIKEGFLEKIEKVSPWTLKQELLQRVPWIGALYSEPAVSKTHSQEARVSKYSKQVNDIQMRKHRRFNKHMSFLVHAYWIFEKLMSS